MGKIKGKIEGRMAQISLLKKVQEKGFSSIDDFVEANLHLLSEEKQQLFNSITRMEKILKKR